MNLEELVKDPKFIKQINAAKAFKRALPDFSEESIVKMAISFCIPERKSFGGGGFQKKEVKIESDPGSYVITFGKNKDKKISQCDVEDLKGYVQWCYDNGAKQGKPPSHALKELKANLDAFMTAPNKAEQMSDEKPPWDGEDIPF